jgi:hypothetical protein
MPPKRKNPRLTVRRKSLNDDISDGSEDETFENEEKFLGRRRSSRLQEKELIYEEVPELQYETSRSLRSSRRNQKKTDDVETLFDGFFFFLFNKKKTSSMNKKNQKKEKVEILQKRKNLHQQIFFHLNLQQQKLR